MARKKAEKNAEAANTAGKARAGRPAKGAKRLDLQILGVPARFMSPRLIFLVCVIVLSLFGLLMIYSASSVTSLISSATNFDPAYYAKRQAIFLAIGSIAALVLYNIDYHAWSSNFLTAIWVVTVVMLLAIFASSMGQGAYGASRWIGIGSFSLQPSEFAKVTVILTAANLAQRYFDDASISFEEFVKLMAAGVGIPLVLILAQPDKGTTMVLAATLLVMGYLAGLPRNFILAVAGIGIVGFLILSLRDDYSRARIVTMFNPWRDYYGDGYQLIQGFYAFGSGGLFGVGLGFSRQKYSYLPMAYNDFIFAVIGEELGLVGTLGTLAVFALLGWAGAQIAKNAPDLAGRLIAAGCTGLIIIQLFVNVGGVLGMIPLTGKPVPFISYGGSTIISCLMLSGLTLSVSRVSRLPETVHDQARQRWQMEEPVDDGWTGYDGGDDGHYEETFVSDPVPRSMREADGAYDARPTKLARSSFTIVEGGAGGRGSSQGSGRSRIDLGPSATERLRGGSKNKGKERR